MQYQSFLIENVWINCRQKERNKQTNKNFVYISNLRKSVNLIIEGRDASPTGSKGHDIPNGAWKSNMQSKPVGPNQYFCLGPLRHPSDPIVTAQFPENVDPSTFPHAK